uniref:DUF6415 family natural product biosynthesis protein n=1 Tax=Streptomyces sp. NBC_00003 TaxID=2903608 RepID=A0AAU2VGU9_9ACTN
MVNTWLGEPTSAVGPAPTRIKDPAVPTRPWTSSHDDETVRQYLSALREWASVDWPQVYDDLDTVLHGEQEMSHHAAGHSGGAPLRVRDDAEELAQRLRGALKLLTSRAVRDSAAEKYADIASLIKLADTLRAEELPGPRGSMGRLRGLAQVTLALTERLAEVGIVKGLVEC